MQRNPFHVLGLNQELVRFASDELIAQFIKNNFRLIQKENHPDKPRGRARERFRLLAREGRSRRKAESRR